MKGNFIKKTIATGLAVCMMASSSIVGAFAASENDVKVSNPVMNSQNWMGFLPNRANMSYINMPGTHDSGTNELMTVNVSKVLAEACVLSTPVPLVNALLPTLCLFAPTVGLVGNISLNAFAKDQNRTIPEQLNDGVRLLDCRLSCFDNEQKGPQNLTLTHGGFKCVDENGDGYRFDRVLSEVKEFLKEHPTETIVVQMQEEGLPFDFKGADNKFVDIMIQALNEELKSQFDVENIHDIKANAKKIMLQFMEDCRKDDSFIVVDDKTDYPTVGEARGKIILTTDVMMTTEDKQPDNITGSYHVTGEGKWNNLTDENKGILNGKEQPLDYTQKPSVKEDGTNERICPRLAATSCASKSDEDYFKDAIQLFLGKSVVGKFAELFGKPIADPDAVSPGEMHAKFVNTKLKAYDWQKGKFYGWIYTDFEDEELCKDIYSTNIFDFDIAGKPLTYISDIKIAFEQSFSEAKENLEDGGYTVLAQNFNEEGPDKGLSDAIVNGKRNNGSFNMAIGYKTTSDPGKAITGITWINKDMETSKLPKDVEEMIKKYNFELVDLYATEVRSQSIKTSQGLADLNIGTAGKLVNLYSTIYGGAGERLTDLTSVQAYNKSKIDIKTRKPINQRIIDKSKKEINTNFANGMETVRNIDGYTLSTNLGRNNINDVHIFYNTAFNSKDVKNAYFPIYTGEGAGEIRELR